MYSNTGYRHGYEKDYFEKLPVPTNCPLQILSCGVYRLITKSYLATSRPLGRPDYQLLYINKGKVRFHISGREASGREAKELDAGHMVLYRPGEPQHYSYELKDHPEVYWLHFSGSEADAFLAQSSFASASCLYTGCSHDFVSLFLQIILELQQKRVFADLILPTLLQQLFFTIHRSLAENKRPEKNRLPEVEHAVSYFRLHFSEEISIQAYAQASNVSTCWFIRCFKKQMGMTPLQYITSLRIQKACELLETTSYTIQEIGELTGYENPLYFSRIFKEKTGLAPREYRTLQIS